MADRIELNDLIDPKLKDELKTIAESIKQVTDNLKSLYDSSKQLAAELKKGAQTQNELSKATKQTGDNTKQLSDVEKEIAKIEQQYQAILTKTVAEQSEQNKTLVEAKVKRQEQNKIINESIRLANTESQSIARLKSENAKLKKERNGVTTATEEGRKKIAELNAKINENDRVIKENTSIIEKQKQNVGNYGSAWDKVKLAIGLAAGVIAGAAGAIRFGKSVIESSKKANDAYEASIGAISAAWDVVKKSISTLDFKDMFTRMADAARAGRDYAKAMAELGDRMRSYRVQEASARAQTDLLREKLTDQNIAIEERIAIGEKLKQSEKSLLELRKDILHNISDAELKALGAKIGLDKDELKQVILSYNASRQTREEAASYAEEKLKYDKKLKKSGEELRKVQESETAKMGMFQDESKKNIDKAANDLKSLQKAREDYINSVDVNVRLYAAAMDRYGNASDAELDKVANALIEEEQAQSEYANNVRRIDNQINTLKFQQSNERIALEKSTNAILKGYTADYYDYYKKVNDQLNEVDKKRLDDKQDIFAEEADEYEKATQRMIDADKKRVEESFAAEEAIRDKKIEISDAGFELFQAVNDREVSDLEARRDYELSLVGDNEEAKERIAKEYAAKIAAIKRKQAIADKLNAIFHAGINIAEGETKALASANIPLATLIGILGALQIATIIAKPIPKFFKGVKNFKGGIAEVGERGWELVEANNQMFITPETATRMMLPNGANVYTHEESKRIVENRLESNEIDRLISEERATRRAIGNRKVVSTTLTQRGLEYFEEVNGNRKKYLDKYLRR